ncbi:GNAT family N-acetyltransferase [Candidatus Stoquefichus massiliensis]|uniref:GNAT family N-acetyltransferase n=1 Tax=Candidatus Stoquefichus massiliensis TaxID=1470350 RepID=UPI00048613E5|nr:GNAT family N-acetyltransferase [Candidatus Stoquefichus massiliensis]
MEIRFATINDIEKIADIEKICFPKAEAATYDEFKERFDMFGECFLVAEDHHQVIGFINGCCTNEPSLPDELYHNPALHQVNGLYQTVFGLDVLPDYRHQGVAGLLLNALITLSKERGKSGVVLTCKDYLIHYYEKFGFECLGKSASNHGGAKWNDMYLTLHKEDI